MEVIDLLRATARALRSSDDYQWGHMGACNCGFLAQQISQLARKDIHQFAMHRHGDWSEQLNDYCPTSGLEMDSLITMMVERGFDTDDLRHLERLSHPDVVAWFPPERRYLRHNVKDDVIDYLNMWADLLDAGLLLATSQAIAREELLLLEYPV